MIQRRFVSACHYVADPRVHHSLRCALPRHASETPPAVVRLRRAINSRRPPKRSCKPQKGFAHSTSFRHRRNARRDATSLRPAARLRRLVACDPGGCGCGGTNRNRHHADSQHRQRQNRDTVAASPCRAGLPCPEPCRYIRLRFTLPVAS